MRNVAVRPSGAANRGARTCVRCVGAVRHWGTRGRQRRRRAAGDGERRKKHFLRRPGEVENRRSTSREANGKTRTSMLGCLAYRFFNSTQSMNSHRGWQNYQNLLVFLQLLTIQANIDCNTTIFCDKYALMTLQ